MKLLCVVQQTNMKDGNHVFLCVCCTGLLLFFVTALSLFFSNTVDLISVTYTVEHRGEPFYINCRLQLLSNLKVDFFMCVYSIELINFFSSTCRPDF